MVGDGESTRCPTCMEKLVERRGFRVLRNKLGPDGACPRCQTVIPGRW
jgi:pyruvate formate lyase activating enzyme